MNLSTYLFDQIKQWATERKGDYLQSFVIAFSQERQDQAVGND